jgi:transcriptional regulator with XRE-family HTH domain
MNPLREARAASGKTVRQLAKESGVHFTTIYELEHDRRKAEIATLGRIAKALNIDWKLLISLSKEDVKEQEREIPKTLATLPLAS